MKILHMTPLFHPALGGIESFTFELLQALQARGHENRVIASHSGAPMPDETCVADILIHRVPLLTGLMQRDPAGLLHSKIRATKIKKAFCADILHLHIGGPVAVLHLITKHVAPAPTVVTVYDLPPRGQDSESIRQTLETASRVAAISQVRLEDCRLIAPPAGERIGKIHVSQPVHSQQEALALSPCPLFLMAGRQVQEKGFDVAVAAFQQVHQRHPSSRLVLAGDGPVHTALADQIRHARLESAVDLAGRLPAADLARLYRQAWGVLVPSRHSESFGLVALEAMQAGCPVIATRVGGLPEVVLNRETGLLIPPDDAQALAAAISQLIEDPVQARKLGQAGQRRANTVFGWNTCVDQYEALYRQVTAP